MPPEIRSRTFYYKRCQFVDLDGGGSLSSLITAAIKAKGAAFSRMQKAPADDGSLRLVNDHILDEAGAFGNLVEWTQGQPQAIIALDETKPTLDISMLPPEERKEFLEGMAYFFVSGNHVVFSRGRGVSSAALEDHLVWLLRECAQVLPPAATLQLLDTPTTETREKFSRVKTVHLTAAPVNPPKRREGPMTVEKFTLRRAVVAAVLREIARLGALKLSEPEVSELMADKSLRASLKITVRGTLADGGVQLLDVLAEALRGSDSDMGYSFDVPGVGRFHGDALTLKTSELLPHPDGQPSLEAMAKQMRAWLLQLIARNEVPGEV